MSEIKVWQKDLHEYPKAFADFPLEPKITALVLVDMQNYDATADYGIGLTLKKSFPKVANYVNSRLKIIVPNCAKLLTFFRKNNLRVLYLAFGASMPDGSDMLPLRKMTMDKVPAFTVGSFEYQIIDELKPVPGELVISKTTRCGFIGTSLDHTLRMVGIDTVAIGGALTNACVESTARASADFGYKTILIDDACLAWNEQAHNATMKSFAIFFGKVMDTDELIEALSQKL